jgi:hypothetical protein
VKINKKNIRWDNLIFKDKMKFFSIWSLTSVISNFATIFGTVFFIMRSYIPIELSNFVLGLGCMLQWFSLIKYLDTTYKYSFITRTFKRALPRVLRAIISIVPIFIGYAFLGMSLFW